MQKSKTKICERVKKVGLKFIFKDKLWKLNWVRLRLMKNIGYVL